MNFDRKIVYAIVTGIVILGIVGIVGTVIVVQMFV